MDEVNESGETLTVTKNGKLVVEVRRAVRKRKTLWGLHGGKAEILGDIVGPVLEDDGEMLK